MKKYELIVESPAGGFILDKEENVIVALCGTKRPDLEFDKLKNLITLANSNYKNDIENFADYLIENASEAFAHQDRELLLGALQRYFEN